MHVEMQQEERIALQKALRGTRDGLSACPPDTPAEGVLSLIEGELLDLLGLCGPRFRRQSDQRPVEHDDPTFPAG